MKEKPILEPPELFHHFTDGKRNKRAIEGENYNNDMGFNQHDISLINQ